MKQIDFFYAAILVKQKIESKIMLTEKKYLQNYPRG